MPNQLRFAVATVVFTAGLVVAARPAQAEGINVSSLQLAAANAKLHEVEDSKFLVAGIATNAAAQQSGSGSRRHEGLGIGFEVGPTFNSFTQANNNFSNNSGWEAGIFFGGNRPGVVGVMGKLLYGKKGSKNESGTTAVDLYYLEIPVLLRVNAGSNSLNGVLVYGVVGPSFDILLKGKQNDLDVKDNYDSLDLGIQFGAGIEITRLIIEANYTKGLRKVNDGNLANLSDIKTQKFAVDFGIRFN